MPRRSLEEADSLAERRKYVRKQNGRAATVWFGRCVVDVNRRPVPVTPGGYIFEWSCAVAGPEPIRARAEALYNPSTAPCRSYKVPLTSFGRPKRNGVHLQRQSRDASGSHDARDAAELYGDFADAFAARSWEEPRLARASRKVVLRSAALA